LHQFSTVNAATMPPENVTYGSLVPDFAAKQALGCQHDGLTPSEVLDVLRAVR